MVREWWAVIWPECRCAALTGRSQLILRDRREQVASPSSACGFVLAGNPDVARIALLRESAGDLDRVQALQYADDARAIARDSQHSEDLARNFTLCRQRPCAREPAPCCGGKWQSFRPGIRRLYGCADGR